MTKTVYVTGASAGIGAAVAEVFAQDGCVLALGARRVEKLEEMVPRLRELGASQIFCHALDVTNKESIDRFVAAARSNLDTPVDILVNNAGLALGLDPIHQGDDAHWDTMIQTNVMGLLRVTRALLPDMIERDSGHIINLGSVAGHAVYEGGGVYAATKFAVNAITKTLRLELNGKKIRVTSVDPGMVETEFSRVRFEGDEDRSAKVYKGVQPLTARDVAEVVQFAANRPPHVNLDQIVMMTIDQASVTKTHRR